ncbi:MAG: hypothetical protein ACR2N3_01545, partial [Pyrinomonadaceae bacterium]
MFTNQFNRSQVTLNFLPQLIGCRQIRTALGADEHASSIFSRRNLTNPDGTRLQINTRAFRHWLNTLADQGGLSDIQLNVSLFSNINYFLFCKWTELFYRYLKILYGCLMRKKFIKLNEAEKITLQEGRKNGKA